ncbi:undecaprenyl-phosphate glucose phosphotransferase [Ramlibacter sp.]|uniref:undecaprenyl-phosphate glucose phosphotransferase n=1 Tax=Ramlibacter sp. TaxID=1917967 RepID=UPI002BC3F696|nr:undecaprenyl-phosphate glucose phosphotransferase [Ramlibacter sp.]HWI80664.1 undecaprenyl-phosphate glucose phosphotransferase [Ramlibacter sp.]
MRIYANCPPGTLADKGRQGFTLRALVDPLVASLTYVLALLAFRGNWDRADTVLLVGMFLLLYPGCVPFNRFTLPVAARLLLPCAAILALFVTVRWLQGRPVAEGGSFELDAGVAGTVLLPLVLLGMHAVTPRLAPHLRRRSADTPVIIVGISSASARFAAAIRSGEVEGQRLVACFEDRNPGRTHAPASLCVTGGIADVADYVKRNPGGIIYISLPMASQPRVLALLEQLRDTTASVCFIPDIFVADLIQGRIETVAGLPVVSVCDTPFRGTEGVMKRALDIVVTLAALPLALPLMLGIALAIRLTSPGPVIFKQRRYGLDGKEILVWKFRTMRTIEDGDGSYRQVTRDDDRVTALGRVLRRTSLDELPQLLNVLAGSMSLVGPRPHALAVNEHYRKVIPGYMIRHKVRPGITGWAQVNGYRGGDDLDAMRKRTEYDLAYLRSWTLGLDLLILARTARMLVAGDPKAF